MVLISAVGCSLAEAQGGCCSIQPRRCMPADVNGACNSILQELLRRLEDTQQELSDNQIEVPGCSNKGCMIGVLFAWDVFTCIRCVYTLSSASGYDGAW